MFKKLCDRMSGICPVNGRIGREEFWVFAAFALVLLWGVQRNATEMLIGAPEAGLMAAMGVVLYFVSVVAMLVLFLFASMVRRLHDAGLPCVFVMLVFVPIIGWIALAAMFAQPSQPETDVAESGVTG